MEKKARYMPVWGRYADLFLSDKLTNAQVGELFRTMLRHYFEEEGEERLSKRLEGFWYFLKMDLDDAQNRYDSIVLGAQKGGQKSAQIRREKRLAKLEEGSAQAQEEEVNAAQAPCSPLEPPYNPSEPPCEAPSSPVKPQVPITRSRSITRTRTESISKTNNKNNISDLYRSKIVSEIKESPKLRFGQYGWVQLTQDEHHQLELMMGPDVLGKCIRYIDQSAQSTGNRNKWQDWFIVLRRCYEGHWYEPKGRSAPTYDAIPTGASGELGEAELEAIRAVMARDIPEVVIEEHPDTFPY